MDYSACFRYFCFRLLIFLGAVATGLLFGKGILWVVSSVLPYSAIEFKNFLIDDTTGSIAAAAVAVVLLGRVFFDDGKKHAAYEDMDVTLVLITLILIYVIYFIPVIFYNASDMTKMVETVYYMFYFPCIWVSELTACDIKIAAALGDAVLMIPLFVLYEISYAGYKRKHPFSFRMNDEEISG